MTPELEQILYAKYPTLFKQKDLPKDQTNMCWGIAVGDGWYNLIDELCYKIVEIAPQTEAVQVKEKFGSLRFYVENTTEEVQDLTWQYSNKSDNICEECGKSPATKNNSGWIRTLCEECNANI